VESGPAPQRRRQSQAALSHVVYSWQGPLGTPPGGLFSGGTPVIDARTYMLALPTNRGHRTQWQRAAGLLLEEADVVALSKVVELALFYDAKLVLTRKRE